MSARELVASALGRGLAALEASWKLRGMERRGELAARPSCIGAPHLDIRGHIEIGPRLLLVSEPIATHIVVHRGARIRIGEDVTIGSGCGIASHSEISIGDRTRLGAYVMILDSDYHVAGKPSERASSTPIQIGSDVSIGNNCTVLRGTRIEDAVIVEPGSVVSGLVPAGIHIGGVPARPLRADPRSTKPISIEIGVLRVAQRAFRLSALPTLTDGPDQIARWDSLGALSFLLALEDRFSITLNPEETAHVADLNDVVSLVQQTLERRAARKLDTEFAPPTLGARH